MDSENNTTVVSGYSFSPELNEVYLSVVPDGERLIIEVVTAPPAEFEGAKIAMLMAVTDLYENRQENIMGVSVAKNPALEKMAWPYRVNLGV